jgi:UMF1 family MFS transporter
MVGVWWIGFAQITFKRLPNDRPLKKRVNMIKKGVQELISVWNIIKKKKNILSFLLSYFFYTAGVQTVLYLAATFAEEILQFEFAELIYIIIVLQFVAIIGAYLFAKVSDLAGNKVSLLSMLFIWIIVCYLAYVVESKTMFYWVAGLVGLVMGGIQAISRSSYSKLLDESIEDHTSFFSFYDVLQKIAIVMGTFSFGFIAQITGGMRNSILALTVFFIIGIVILSRTSLQPDFKRKTW